MYAPMARAPQAGGTRRFSGAQWHLQKIVNDSVDSSDDEFFDAREEIVEGKSAILIGMSQWNSNDLVEQIETIGKLDESPGELYRVPGRKHRCPRQSSFDIHEDSEDVLSQNSCKTHVLALVLHGGSILDTGGGDMNSKMADVNTFSSVFEKVTRAHFPAALGHILVKLVPCPAICSEAFSLVYNLNPYSYDENCLNISEDHIPLAALPLLAISSPQYQDAVAMVISRANQVYNEFLKSPDGAGFNGQAHEVDDLLYEEVVLPESDVEFEQNQEESSEDESADGATAAVSTNPVSFQALLQRLREPIDEENRLNPWCFQDDPQWGPDEERPQLMEDTEGRLQNNQWCKCGSCKKMTTVEESICCCEFQAMDRLRHNITCVTQHPDFTSRIYSRDFLIELLQFSLRVTQRQFERQENRFLRWACYVKVTNLVYGFLGQGNRIPLPSCVVNKIRDIYPDPNATYTGFKWFPDYVFGDLPTNLNF